MTPTELAEIDADRSRARRVFVGWLVLATALTLAGNAAAAVLPSLPPTAVRLAVHLLPPLIALVGLHALTALARAGAIHRARKGVTAALRDAGPVYGGAVAGVLGIAALAVTLSYAGLIAVARAGGLSHGLAAVWPLTIDLGIAVSTMALLVLRPISAADQRAARRAAKATAAAPSPQLNSPAPAAVPSMPQPAPRPAVPSTPQPAATAAPKPAAAPVVVTDAHRRHAAGLIDGGVTKPVEVVADVLARLDAGHSPNRINTDTGIHHVTVKAWRAALAEADDSEPAQPHLTAVH
jgi:hypothetical protein